MRTFAIALNKANPDIVERIERKYLDHYRITDTSAMIVKRSYPLIRTQGCTGVAR